MSEVQKKSPTAVVTPTFRASYPKVFKPETNKLSRKLEYSVEALFPKDADLSGLKAAAKQAMIVKFGADETKWPKNCRSPFRDQVEKEKEGKLPDGCVAGAIFMRFKSDKKPGVVDQDVQPIMDEAGFYAGCFAKAHVNAFAYYEAGNAGVSFSLNHVQFVKDGDSFSGRPTVESAFAPIAGTQSSENPKDATSLF